MFTKSSLLSISITFGVFVFFDTIEYGLTGETCDNGDYCSYPSYCCGSICCSSNRSDMKSVLDTMYSVLGVAVIFMLIFMCCKCCCNSTRRGVVYQPGVMNQTLPVGALQPPPQQFGYQPPVQQYGFQQQIPPNVMYPTNPGVTFPYQQQSSVNPYYPGAPPPYTSVPPTAPQAAQDHIIVN